MTLSRVHTYAALDEITAAQLNAIQDAYIAIAQGLNGTLSSRPILHCDNGTRLDVYPLQGLWIGDAAYSSAGQIQTSLTGLLTAGHWHYVYAKIVSSAIAIEISAADAGPSFEGGYVWKDNAGTPDKTRRYLGCLRAIDANTAYPFRATGGEYVWRRAAASLTTDSFELATTSTGSATSWEDVDCSKFVPPHAELIALDVEFKGRSGNDDLLELCTKSDNAQAWRMTARSAASPNVAKGFARIPVAGAPLGIRYQVGNASDQARFFANGFREAVG